MMQLLLLVFLSVVNVSFGEKDYSCTQMVCAQTPKWKSQNGFDGKQGTFRWMCHVDPDTECAEQFKYDDDKKAVAETLVKGVKTKVRWCYGTTCDYESSLCSVDGMKYKTAMRFGAKPHSEGDCAETPKKQTAHQSYMALYPGQGQGRSHGHYQHQHEQQQAFIGNGYDAGYDAGYYYHAAQPQNYLYAAGDVGSQYSMAVLLPIFLMVVLCVGIICACFGVAGGWFCYFMTKTSNETSNHSKYSRVQPYNDQEV